MNNTVPTWIRQLLYAVTLLMVASCGSSSSSDGKNATLVGNAIKGPLKNAEILLFYFDENGREVEFTASNAPVKTDSNGHFSFSVSLNKFPSNVGPAIVRTVGGTTDPDNGAAPILEAMIPDLAAHNNGFTTVARHLSTASSVAAGLLRMEANILSMRPSVAVANALMDRVEKELGVDLDDDPSDMSSTSAALNRDVDALLLLQKSSANNKAVNEYVDYLTANLASTSGKLDGHMYDAANPGVDMDASLNTIGSGTLAALFPDGPTEFRALNVAVDKSKIENDGLDSINLTLSIHDGVGNLLALDDPDLLVLKVTSGKAIIGARTLSHIGGTVDVRLSSLWSGPLVVDISYTLKNGAVLTETVNIEVLDRVAGESDAIAPRIVSAVAISNTEVVVTFTEALLGGMSGAENPAYYSMTAVDLPGQPAYAALVDVTDARLIGPAYSSVLLKTQPQSGITYKVQVSNLRDLAGNSFEPPSREFQGVDPSSATFVGVPPSGAEIVHSDDDSLSDSDELFGWAVIITTPSGETITTWVTSDPLLEDTDGDGVTDNEEKHGGINPRSADSDGDTLTDNQEWNQIYSDPSNQDTDGDGTQDGFEFYSYRTSPVLADTDGDQISDTEEILGRNRNPRIADLPRAGIRVGEVRLQIDERYTYVNEQGETVTQEDSSSSSLSQGQDTTFTSGNTDVTEFVGTTTLLGGWESKDGRGSPTPYSENSGPFINVGRNFQYTDSTAFSTDRTSAIASQRVYEKSLNKVREFDTGSSVTREIIGASINVDLTIKNEGGIAFTISNLEITVLQRDRQSSKRYVPVATLIPDSTLINGSSAINGSTANYNLGPFNSERGPILFSSRDVFPNLVEQLMKSPGGLIFKVANFDITDEFGRVFNFSNQLARDRTAGIIVDFGDGVEQKSLVATATQPDPDGFGGPAGDMVGGFFSDGSPKGIALDFALQDIMKLNKNASTVDGIVAGPNREANSVAGGDDVQLIPLGTTGVSVGSIVISSGQNGILESSPSADDVAGVTTGYETSLTCNADSSNVGDACSDDSQCNGSSGVCQGPEVLVRFGGQRNGDYGRQWVVLTNRETPAGADFGKVILKPGTDITLAFVQDLDEDGLYAREEYMMGSTDSRADVFDNSLFGKDFDENAVASFAADGIPDSKDTDRDGLGDFAEVRVGWKVSVEDALQQVFSSPRLRDSDGDTLADPEEQDLRSFCEVSGDPRVSGLCAFQGEAAVEQNSAVAIIAGPNGIVDTSADPEDEQLIIIGADGLPYSTPVIGVGNIPGIQTLLDGDDLYESITVRPPATDPSVADTDLDGVNDYDELQGFNIGLSIRDGGNGVADTQANGDDVQRSFLLSPVKAGGIVILPGPNGEINSTPNGDREGDDIEISPTQVVTDPLRRDTDNDFVTDGVELAQAGDPTNPLDGQDFRDSDQDGITDAEEDLGWRVRLNGGSTYIDVKSNPSLPDSDRDGLPDFIERDLRTNPNNPDTDGDGLRDFDEVSGLDFERFFGLDEQFPNFSVDGASSEQYGTDPTATDTDLDGISDYDELLVGYRILLAGESSYRQIFTSPLSKDTDYDGRDDNDEMQRTVSRQVLPYALPSGSRGYIDSDGIVTMISFPNDTFKLVCVPGDCLRYGPQDGYLVESANGSFTLLAGIFFTVPSTILSAPTDATTADTDGDGSTDGQEFRNGVTDPLVSDLAVTIAVTNINLALNNDSDLVALPGGGNQVRTSHSFAWFFTTKSSREYQPTLLSDARDQKQLTFGAPGLHGWIGWEADFTQPLICPVVDIPLGAIASFDLYGSRTLVLREGESFALNGLMAEIDNVSSDCGIAPRYIPTYVEDQQGCVLQVNETFRYEDFIKGTSGQQDSVSINSLGCNVDLIYTISAQ